MGSAVARDGGVAAWRRGGVGAWRRGGVAAWRRGAGGLHALQIEASWVLGVWGAEAN